MNKHKITYFELSNVLRVEVVVCVCVWERERERDISNFNKIISLPSLANHKDKVLYDCSIDFVFGKR